MTRAVRPAPVPPAAVPPVATRQRRDWALWRRWTLATTLGEAAGFCVPAIAGGLAAAAGLPAGVAGAALLAAGAAEGYVLGAAQAWALRTAVPNLPGRAFATATAAAAVLAYVIGLVPSTLAERIRDLPPSVVVPAAVLGGLALLASIGTAQWLVLRRAGHDVPWWIATTAGGWLAGLTVFMAVATPLWRLGQPAPLVIAIGVFAGALMAVTVAATTGFAALRLARAAEGSTR
jgi:hypothetical protein